MRAPSWYSRCSPSGGHPPLPAHPVSAIPVETSPGAAHRPFLIPVVVVMPRVIRASAFGGDEVLAAAYWRHENGEYDQPDEVVRADKALGDLFARTDPVKPLSRDDARLRSRYLDVLDAHKAAQVDRWRKAVAAEDRRLAGSAVEARGILKSLTPKEHKR